MKKRLLLSVGIIFILIIAVLASCGGKAVYKAGTYEGDGTGHGGAVRLAVTVDEQKIVKIEVLENNESDFSKPVFEKIIKSAIDGNTADVDAVSGASETSEALKSALKQALSQAYLDGAAGAGAAAAAGGKAAAKAEDMSCDVVVVGAGGAGLSAAIAATNNGAAVIVLEKMPVVGGNTNYATGGLNAAETAPQKAKGIQDSADVFFEDTMKGGKNLNNPELVRVLADESAATIDWLIGMGGDFSDVGRLAGATNNRAHRPTGGAAVGNHLVQVLYKAAQAKGINIQTESKVTSIIVEGGVVKGVEVSGPAGDFKVTAPAVVIATGGFGSNQDKVVEFKPALKGFGTTNHPGATGDALDLVKPLNAALVDIEQIQTHPTVVPVKNTMITEAVRGNGAILVNRDGARFISELQTRDVVSDAELAQKGQTAFLFFDQSVRESLSAIESYIRTGLVTEGETVEAVAAKLGIDGAALKATVDKYNGYVASGKDADFARPDMPRSLSKAPYYMVEVGPAVHHTMGGIKIDASARVIDNNGKPVAGLYAAGEVTGGVHGANRLGGNALSDITTFGRIAGAGAAAFAK